MTKPVCNPAALMPTTLEVVHCDFTVVTPVKREIGDSVSCPEEGALDGWKATTASSSTEKGEEKKVKSTCNAPLRMALSTAFVESSTTMVEFSSSLNSNMNEASTSWHMEPAGAELGHGLSVNVFVRPL